jgi:hypothetical protein
MIQLCHKCSECEIADGKGTCRADAERRDIVKLQTLGCPLGKFPARPPAQIAEDYQTSQATVGRCCS